MQLNVSVFCTQNGLIALPCDERSYHIHSTTLIDHCSSGRHGDLFQQNGLACVDEQTDHRGPVHIRIHT